jgi:hypothetical protein
MGLDMYLNRKSDDEEVGYWRKANAIHGWIVENVQNSEDECKTHLFTKEKMTDLLHVCKLVSSDVIKNSWLLPPRRGFFFGGYEVDEYYLQDIEYTIDVLEKCINEPSEEFEYCSSW